jgi:hypothetical protein
MGKQITAKKRAFAKHYAQTGDVTASALAAGYAYPQPCWRFIKKNASGQYTDEVMRALLAGFGAVGVEAPPPKLPLPAKIRQHRQLAKVLNLSDHRPQPIGGELSVEAVHNAMWEMANDIDAPAGPRVQALNVLLKDLRDLETPAPLDDTDLIDQLRIKLGVAR